MLRCVATIRPSVQLAFGTLVWLSQLNVRLLNGSLRPTLMHEAQKNNNGASHCEMPLFCSE